MVLLKSILGFGSIFGIFTFWMYFLTKQFQSINVDTHFPKDFEDLKNLSNALKESQKRNYCLVIVWFCSAYLYKQTFAIPGSSLANILGGALFGSWVAFPLICFLSSTGATFCFLISKHFGYDLLMQRFSSQIASMQQKVNENQSSLFYFLLSIRLFPATPNWFLNVTSPIIGIPIIPFYFSVLLGLIPYNFVCVHAGDVLSTVSTTHDIFSFPTIFAMLLITVVALLPGVVIRNQRFAHETV